MRVRPTEHSSAKFARGGLATSRRDVGGPGAVGTTSVPAAAAPPPDPDSAYAVLAEQCRSRVDGLPPRQRDVLMGLLAGHSNKQIAYALGISPRTIEVYRAGMMVRLNAPTLAHVLHIAFVAGLSPTDMTLPEAG